MVHVCRPQRGGDRNLNGEVGDRHGTAIILEQVDEIRPFRGGTTGDPAGCSNGMND